MYTVAVSFTVPADRRAEFAAAALEDGRRSTADEPGTRAFDLIADASDPNRFFLYEAYDDEAAFDRHCEGEHFARFFEAVGGWAEGPTWLLRGNTVTETATV
ncbi:antibiotic biosynthesis monooxygenase [Streptomyces sp. MUSC 14]|uniref:putative quinol monooxygenase n=1 Tax=Streptomyces sp. MUSC 14 TaxID=1354889 RepID=UPI0008F58941|nr:putative quinol monooxygenase [Streptomyces sp. MUSC 14]OIJ88652.1 antibiotic biosynthesis monooxygenase [Streptomyces sp. MUSC 14]